MSLSIPYPAASSAAKNLILDRDVQFDVRQRVQSLLGRLEQLIGKAIASAPGRRPAINANRLARVIVTFTRGLAVMERAGYGRKQLKEAAGTFVDALVGDA